MNSLRVGVHTASPVLDAAYVVALERQPGTRAVVVQDVVDLVERASELDVLVVELPADEGSWRVAEAARDAGLRRLVVVDVGLGPDDLPRCHAAGASALVGSSSGLEELVHALRPAPLRITRFQPDGHLLDEQERAVLHHLVEGCTAAESAKRLGVRLGRVHELKRDLFVKLGVQHQTHALARALELGLLDRLAPQPAGRPSTAQGVST